jgi:hypothetical protein
MLALLIFVPLLAAAVGIWIHVSSTADTIATQFNKELATPDRFGCRDLL